MSDISDAFSYGSQAHAGTLNKWQAAQAQYQALGNQNGLLQQAYDKGIVLGQQWAARAQQQSITDHQALAQQWRDRAEDQTRFALQTKCEEAYQDHMDNAVRFEQWAVEAADHRNRYEVLCEALNAPKQTAIDYLAITREVSA